MKEIKAIIQPFKLDAVLDALHHIEGAPGVMASEVRLVLQPKRAPNWAARCCRPKRA